MSAIVLEGGSPLRGEVRIRGAKNLVTKAMVASMLGSSPSVLSGVPAISDVEVVTKLLRLHGVRIVPGVDPSELLLDPSGLELASASEVDVHAGSSRIPILFCGPLLHRLGRAFIPDLGGCRIGERPIDFHLDVLRSFGAAVEKRPEGLLLSAASGLRGALVELPFPSVGATEQVLLTSVLAKGVTELRNAAVEPEIVDLVCALQQMGASIRVGDDRTILVEGVSELSGFNHQAIPDRIEAGSWAAAALATGGDVYVEGARQVDMLAFLDVFQRAGGGFDVDDAGIRFYHPGGQLEPVAVETGVHPGFMTDWQQPMVVAFTQASGMSLVHETVYEERLGFTAALQRMGAEVSLSKLCVGASCRFASRFVHSATVSGRTPLRGTDLVIPDLRGGFSYVIAALAAEGTSRVSGMDLVRRGYEDFTGKLSALGARFELVDEAAPLPV